MFQCVYVSFKRCSSPRGGKSCVVVVPITPHTIHIGHTSHHHDRCCVGSDRVSDSVAEKPISASSDSRVYQRWLCTTSPSPKLIVAPAVDEVDTTDEVDTVEKPIGTDGWHIFGTE